MADDFQLLCILAELSAEKTGVGFESCLDSWLLCLSRSLGLPSFVSQHYPLLPFPEQMSGLLCGALSSCCEHICSESEPSAPLHLEG